MVNRRRPKRMKNKIIFFLLIVTLAGCSPTKRLARLLEKYPLPVGVDTVYSDTTIYKDTTVYVTLPGEVVRDCIYIDVPVILPDTAIYLETSLAYSYVYLRENRVISLLYQRDSVLAVMLDSAIRTHSDTIKITEVTTVPKYIQPKSFKFYRSGFFILSVLIVLTIALFFLLGRRR